MKRKDKKLINYTITSGELRRGISVPYEAEAVALAIIGIETGKAKFLSGIIEVRGGQYRGKNVVYLSTEHILMMMGWRKNAY